jgi:hypothetical protein
VNADTRHRAAESTFPISNPRIILTTPNAAPPKELLGPEKLEAAERADPFPLTIETRAPGVEFFAHLGF